MLRCLTLSLCAVLILSGCQEQTTAKEEVIRPIRAIQVGTHEEFSERKFPGRAAASDAVTLAFEVPGKLNEIPVSVGDFVKKGDVLAFLDDRDFQNALNQAKAELKRAQAQYERMRNALADNAVSRQDVTNAEAAYDSAKAVVEIQQKALDDTRLLAPYDAVITEKLVQSFGNVVAKQPAIRLINPAHIEMEVDIPEDLISFVREGMEINVTFDVFPNTLITSTISEISSEASQATRTYPVTLMMDQPEDIKILPGMSGTAWREVEQTNATLPEDLLGFNVPITAVLSETDGKTYVWVIDQDTGAVRRVEIETGTVTRTGVLVKGLNGGEFIATAGVNSLIEGQKVRMIK